MGVEREEVGITLIMLKSLKDGIDATMRRLISQKIQMNISIRTPIFYFTKDKKSTDHGASLVIEVPTLGLKT